MKNRLWMASALALAILAFALITPDAPADDPSQGQEPESAATATPESSEPPASEPPPDEPLETFEPTEKLSAESAVSFPVDI